MSLLSKKSTVFILGAAAFVGVLGGVIWTIDLTSAPAAGEPIFGCRVTDGDTVRCMDERIRLLGIDAPELPGHCRGNRKCAPGDPYASTDSLKDALAGSLSIDRIGEDRYGRTLATMSGRQGDLSCWQLSQGQAIYKDEWDNGGRVAALCPEAAR